MCFMETPAALTVAVSDTARGCVAVVCLEGSEPHWVRAIGHDDMVGPCSLACSDANELVVSCFFCHVASICIFDALGDLCMTLRCNDTLDNKIPSVCIHEGAIYTSRSVDTTCTLLEVCD
jgi:hypothetical protein